MSVEIVNEPAPPPRQGPRMKCGCEIKLVDQSTGEVQTVITPDYVYQNERRLRE